MQCVAITGASGFVGQHLLASIARRENFTVHALAHHTPDDRLPRYERVRWFHGDLSDACAMSDFLVPGAMLVNLAYPAAWTRDQHLEANTALANAAFASSVTRVVHCSTAVVVGKTPLTVVSETTPVQPRTDYEKTKFAIEELWRHKGAGKFDLAILRPSAIFGPHGRNLLKLADALTTGNRFTNYLRSSLFGRRRMNLICVQNLVAAIELLIDYRLPLSGRIFLASDDDEAGNNFRAVETSLMNTLRLKDYILPPLRLPSVVLRTCLRVADATKPDPFRVYDNSMLLRLGWVRRRTLADGIAEFGAWYAATRNSSIQSR